MLSNFELVDDFNPALSLLQQQLLKQRDEEERKIAKKGVLDHAHINKLATRSVKEHSTLPDWLAIIIGILLVACIAGVALHISRNNDAEITLTDLFQDSPSPDIYNNVKLPKALIPISYILYLSPQMDQMNYTGLVKIKVKCVTETSHIILHSSNHKILEVAVKTVNVIDIEDIKISNQYRNTAKEMVIMNLMQSLVVGYEYNIFIGFNGVLTNKSNEGMTVVHYKDGDGRIHHMLSSMFNLKLARKVFPCFDEPEYKATFQLIIQHCHNYNAIANMPSTKMLPLKNPKYVETFFKVSPPMSSQDLSFIVSEYVFKEAMPTNGVQFRAFAPTGRLNTTDAALMMAPLFADYYKKLFNFNYTLPKLDLVPVTRFVSVEGDWGIIKFFEPKLLFDPNSGSTTQIENIARAVANGIVKQWFDNLVTMVLNGRWLQESLAYYYQCLPAQYFYPSWDFKTLSYLNYDQALKVDGNDYATTLTSTQQEQDYNAKFQKGAAVMNMLSNYLGKTSFSNAIKIFLQKHKFGSTNVQQFEETMTAADDNIDVIDYMNSWKSQAGFPLITVTVNDNQFVIKQERFTYNNISEERPDRSIWHLPMLIKYSNNSVVTRYVLRTSIDRIAVPKYQYKWFKSNFGAIGFYRVNYNDENWLALLEQLNGDHTVFSAIDRANLISDIFELSSMNYRKIFEALNFTRYLAKEHHSVPYEIALNHLTRIADIFNDTKVKHCMQKYILQQIMPVINFLNSHQSHDHIHKHLITKLTYTAVLLNNKKIVRELDNMFLKWLISGHRNIIPGHIREVVFKTGIMYGQHYEWDRMLKYYKKAISVVEKEIVLKSLAVTTDVNLLKRLLQYARNPLIINPIDKVLVLQEVCQNKLGKTWSWTVIKKDWKSLRQQNSMGCLRALLLNCLGSGSTLAELKQVQHFSDLKETCFHKTLLQIMQKIQQNIAYKQRKREVVTWCRNVNPTCLQ